MESDGALNCREVEAFTGCKCKVVHLHPAGDGTLTVCGLGSGGRSVCCGL